MTILAALVMATACGGRMHTTEVISADRPAYPDSLRAEGIEGRVTVQVVVDTSGRVEPGSAVVVQSPNAGFNQAALAFVYTAHFRPAKRRGHAVRAVVEVPIDFKLDRRGALGIFRVDQVDQAPTIASAVAPAYPASVKTARVDVRVVVSAVIDTLGRAEPGSVHIVSSPGADFDEPARAYVLGARFWPGGIGGRKVRVIMDVQVDFKAP
ncbi:MAG TPA: TonB family protein [Gemmatimonadales bacterium]|nr:TonB family protein [Gemmatimonadales bacterium]